MKTLLENYGDAVRLVAGSGAARVLVVCEHASNRIPEALGDLGLDDDARNSHIAWDPGALNVAKTLAANLRAPLVHGTISRLVYDCNRPPEAPSAIVQVSEDCEIPGNVGLATQARQARVDHVYVPFHRMLGQLAKIHGLKLLVSIHSFTPVYKGVRRDVEIGLLHGKDDRFARAMLANRPSGIGYDTRLNEPYGPLDGVLHTIELHGPPNGNLSVMVEVRSDLISNAADEDAMAACLADWIETTLQAFPAEGA
ncbi:MAG: N-formylglutamate amidohydrolase [Pseudomonadota bacterium]